MTSYKASLASSYCGQASISSWVAADTRLALRPRHPPAVEVTPVPDRWNTRLRAAELGAKLLGLFGPSVHVDARTQVVALADSLRDVDPARLRAALVLAEPVSMTAEAAMSA